MRGSSGGLEFLIVLLFIGALVALYVLFIRRNAPYAHTNAFGRHLNFDHYHLDTIIKVLYMFALVTNVFISLAIVGIVFSALGNSDNGIGYALAGLLTGVITFAVLQGLARMAHEMIIIYVHMAEDVRGIRDGLGFSQTPRRKASKRSADDSAAVASRPNPVSSLRSAIRQSDVVRSAIGAPAADQAKAAQPAEPGQGPWTCASCGASVNSGKFCPKCGSPRA